MKKIKILSFLMALLLCSSILMVSCGKDEYTPYKISDVMNAEYEIDKSGVIGEIKEADFKGEITTTKYNFVITNIDPNAEAKGEENAEANAEKSEVSNVISTMNVYYVTAEKNDLIKSFNDVKEKKTETENENTVTKNITIANYIHVISEDYFAVVEVSMPTSASGSKSQYFGCLLNSDEDYEYTLTVYEKDGSVAETFKNDVIKSISGEDMKDFDKTYYTGEYALAKKYKDAREYFNSSNSDLYVIGSEVYRFDADLKSELVKDYGFEAVPKIGAFHKVGDYYLEDMGDYRDTYFSVYDKDLNKLYEYMFPTYIDDEMDIGVCELLSNGKLFVQYLVQLDQNEKKFDIRDSADGKYDLVTLLVDASGATEVKDVNFLVGEFQASFADLEGKKMYADSVENLAFIYPIGKNKMIDGSISNQKLVLINNAGEVTGEVVTEDKVSTFPMQYMGDSYVIRLTNGNYAVYNKSGEKVKVVTSKVLSSYITDDGYVYVEGDAIYDAEGKMVYDVGNQRAKVEKCGNTFIISTVSETVTTYSLFKGGELETIGKIDSKTSAMSTIKDKPEILNGYYYVQENIIPDPASTEPVVEKYTYYNDKGEKIGTFENVLEVVYATEDYILMKDATKNIIYKTAISK